MPTVAMVDGIKIQFYWDEHPPPHFMRSMPSIGL
jgi:hypothetical protein